MISRFPRPKRARTVDKIEGLELVEAVVDIERMSAKHESQCAEHPGKRSGFHPSGSRGDRAGSFLVWYSRGDWEAGVRGFPLPMKVAALLTRGKKEIK